MALNDVALVLGPLVFAGFEVPEGIGFGGSQRLAVHELAGGGRTIDLLGPEPDDIGWSGVFAGSDAASRARLADGLRVAGAVLPLSWGGFLYPVVIRSFQAEFRGAFWIPYRMVVSVVQEPVADPVLGAATAALGSLLGTDAGQAGLYATAGGVALGALATAMAATGASTLGTAAYVAAGQALGTAQTQMDIAGTQAATVLAGYAQAGLGSAADVAGALLACGNAANLAAGSAFLGRLSTNLEQASS